MKFFRLLVVSGYITLLISVVVGHIHPRYVQVYWKIEVPYTWEEDSQKKLM